MGCQQHLITCCKIRNHQTPRMIGNILPQKIALLGEAIFNIKIIYGKQITTHTRQIFCTYNNMYDVRITTNTTQTCYTQFDYNRYGQRT